MSSDVWPGALAALLFAGGWCLTLRLLAHFSGWSALAESYRAADVTEGTILSFQSARIGGVSYSMCLGFVARPSGLHLGILLPFRPWHPPLFIPWSDMTMELHEGRTLGHADVRLLKHPDTRVRLSLRLARLLLSAGGNVVQVRSHPARIRR